MATYWLSKTAPIKLISTILGITATFVIGLSLVNMVPEKKPNVVLIVADDIAIGRFKQVVEDYKFDLDKYVDEYDVGDSLETINHLTKSLQYSRKSTEPLARLAKKGVYFNNAYSTNPFCGPSRYSILTGQYPQRSNIWFAQELYLSENIDTFIYEKKLLPEIFKSSGYNTGLVGKWHINEELLASRKEMPNDYLTIPINNGFDFSYYFDSNGIDTHLPSKYFNTTLRENIEIDRPQNVVTIDLFTDKCLDFIQNAVSTKDPFFLFYSPHITHCNKRSLAAKKYFNEIDPLLDYNKNKVASKMAINDINEVVNYNAHVLSLTKSVLKIIAKLKEEGVYDNTIFCFTSDQGTSYNVPFPSNNPYEGYKGQVSEGGLRVPLFFFAPKLITEPKSITQLVMNFDIGPTLLGMCNIESNINFDGKDLSPLINGKADQVSPNEVHDKLVWTGFTNEFQAKRINPEDYNQQLDGQDAAWMIKDSSHTLKYSYCNFELYKNGESENIFNDFQSNQKKSKMLLTSYFSWLDDMESHGESIKKFERQYEQITKRNY